MCEVEEYVYEDSSEGEEEEDGLQFSSDEVQCIEDQCRVCVDGHVMCCTCRKVNVPP